MAAPNQDDVRNALEQFCGPEVSALFNDQDVEALLQEGYTHVCFFEAAKQKYLELLGLKSSRVSLILRAQEERRKQQAGESVAGQQAEQTVAAQQVVHQLAPEVMGLLRDMCDNPRTTGEAAEPQQQKAVGFSAVKSMTVHEMLRACGVSVFDSAVVDPVSVPEGAPAIPTFDFAVYESERAGASDFREYHQTMLAYFQVPFGGRQGYEVCNLQDQATCLRFQVNAGLFDGTADCCVARRGLLGAVTVKCLQVLFVHKQTREQKEEHRRRQSQQAESVKSESPEWAAEDKEQSIAVLLRALATCNIPAMVVLTDGTVHHLLQLRLGDFYVWRGLSPTQAYQKLANILRGEPVAVVRRRKLEDMEQTDDVKEFIKLLNKIQAWSTDTHGRRPLLIEIKWCWSTEIRTRRSMQWIRRGCQTESKADSLGPGEAQRVECDLMQLADVLPA